MGANIDYQFLLDKIEKLELKVTKLTAKKTYFDINELSKRTSYKVNTLYKKLDLLTEGIHFYKANGGKLLFDESAVDFLVKGVNHGKSLHTKGQPLGLGEFFSQQK